MGWSRGARRPRSAPTLPSHTSGLLETDDTAAALAGFQEVVTLERAAGAAAGGGVGAWGFKALKQMVKLRARSGDAAAMLQDYGAMLAAASSGAVSRAAAEKKLGSLLDHLAASASGVGGTQLMEQVYAATLAADPPPPDRLALRTRLRLAGLWLDGGRYELADGALQELRRLERRRESRRGEEGGESAPSTSTPHSPPPSYSQCAQGDAAADARHGTNLLDVLALEIGLHTARGDAARLRATHAAALGVTAAIPHPRVTGAVKECGGRLRMADGSWAAAATDFFDSFRAYDEAGDSRRTRCLVHAALATLLMQSGVDPFEAQEARPFREHRDVRAATALVAACQAGDAVAFEEVVAKNRETLGGDPLVAAHLPELRATARAAAALRALAPYSRVRLSHLATALGVSEDEAEAVAACLILDGRLDASLDAVARVIEVAPRGGVASSRGLAAWAARVEALSAAAVGRVGGGG